MEEGLQLYFTQSRRMGYKSKHCVLGMSGLLNLDIFIQYYLMRL